MSTHDSLNQLAQTLEQKTLDLIQAGDWPALEAMIAAECQFVTNGGIINEAEAMALMQALRSEGDVQTHVQTINVLGRVFGLKEEDETPRVGK